MKTRKPKILYEQQLPVAEEERVTKVMRKGKPNEYTELLVKAKTDTGIMMEKAIEEAKDGVKSKAAKIYVRKLYNILIKYDYTSHDARVIVVNDCQKIWALSYVIENLPKEAKDQSKRIGGEASGKARKQKAKAKVEEFVKEHQDKLPGLASASEETRKAVSKLGGETLRDLYGPKHFREMGDRSADKWTKLKEEAKTLQLHMETEEHRELERVFEQSLIARANGTGGYIIFVTNGEFDHAEADTKGKPEKTVNK